MSQFFQPAFSARTQHFLDRANNVPLINGINSALSGPTSNIIDPSTGAFIATLNTASASDVDRAVAAARQSFTDGRWRNLPASQREYALHRLADLIEKHADELAEIEAINSGKIMHLVRDIDIAEAVLELRYIAGWPSRLNGLNLTTSNRLPSQLHAFSRYEAIGVSALITPWNSPLLMSILKLAPALAAGCSLVLKPAELTPLTTLRLAELIADAGIPAGVVNIIHGGPDVGRALVNHPDIDKIAFTGSTATGKSIARSAAERLARVTLELGGSAPVIIMPDADLEAAAIGAGRAAFFNNGQSCVAGVRLYVHASIYNQISERLIATAQTLKLGAALSPETEMGPLISAAHRDKVMRLIHDAEHAGANRLAGGEIVGDAGYFLSPTVMSVPQGRHPFSQEEVFGPVVTITPFESSDEAIQMANATPYGLAASLWSQDLSTMHTMSQAIRAGVVWGNCHGVFDPALPFGGYKLSGIGREQGLHGILNYMEHKTTAFAL